jgi:type IV secretion system protein VirB11
MSAEPWPEFDERDRIERDAAEDSRARFLKLLGPLRQYLEDRKAGEPAVFNANVNGGDEGAIFVETADGKFEAPETMSRADRQALITNIATKCETAINSWQARLPADMPHGFDVRIQAFCPPADDWTISCRVNAEIIFPLDKYIEIGWLTANRRAAIRKGIARGGMIGVVGRRGSGKTTFLNGLLHEAALVRPKARLVVIQDRKEVKPSHRDRISIMAGIEQARYEGGRRHTYTYEYEDALKDGLRTDFDMIAFNELRDGRSARTLLNALNTGGGGCFGTWHANTAIDGLYRLEELLGLNGEVPPRRMIARVVDMIVVMGMDDERNRWIDDVALVGAAADDYSLESVAA